MYDQIIEGDLVKENYGLKGKVNSIFDHVINISTDKYHGFAITDQTVIMAPYHIKLSNNNFKKIRKYLNENSIILIDNNYIKYNNKFLKYNNKNSFHGIIKETSYNKDKLIKNTEYIIKNFAKNGSLDKTIINFKSIIKGDLQLLTPLQKHFYKILKDIINGKKNANDLLGLGIGLTPTGDDFIVGYLSAVEAGLCDDKYQFRDVLTTKGIFNKTTNVSALHLNGVLEHRFNAQLVVLYKNIDNSDINYINNAKKLIKIGSTSGLDMLSGIYFALTM
ncbi:MAG: DUF2877 domain-containing protein [Halanaerobiales bacterium]|nr:DUF2877 domain-containing protein [Halanaerobiales bacterium]